MNLEMEESERNNSWTLWRIWNPHILEEILEHIEFKGCLNRKIGIIKMISDYFNSIQNSINFTEETLNLVEILSKENQIQKITFKKFIEIQAREIRFAENWNLLVSEEENNCTINIYTDLGDIFDKIAEEGDLLIFAGKFRENRVINCNHFSLSSTDEGGGGASENYIIIHRKIEKNFANFTLKINKENLGSHLLQRNFTTYEYPNAVAQKLTIPLYSIIVPIPFTISNKKEKTENEDEAGSVCSDMSIDSFHSAIDIPDDLYSQLATCSSSDFPSSILLTANSNLKSSTSTISMSSNINIPTFENEEEEMEFQKLNNFYTNLIYEN